MSTHAPEPGFRCAGLRLTAAWSVPGGIRGIHPPQCNITLRYIQATQLRASGGPSGAVPSVRSRAARSAARPGRRPQGGRQSEGKTAERQDLARRNPTLSSRRPGANLLRFATRA